MKKNKFISVLTALSLMVIPSVPLTANARTLPNNNGGTNGSVEEFVNKTFGEDAIVEYSPSNILFFVITPDDIGDFNYYNLHYIVKVKESSDVDLIGEVENHCSDCMEHVDIEKIDDKTYKVSLSPDTYKYPNALPVEEFQRLWKARSDERDKAFSKTISFLSEHGDVASIDRYYDFSYESVNSPEGSRILGFSIDVSGDVDFDYEKYADYVVESNVTYDNVNYLSVYYDSEEDYFKRMYDAYVSLTEDYGEENVNMSACIQESVVDLQTQTAGENIYTAAVKGDINNNGVIDIADVVAISAYVNDPENNPLGEKSITNGDVHNTGDGLTSSDVLKIQQYIAGIITEL